MGRSRVKMKLLLEKQGFERTWNCRNISEEDIPVLGDLMLESYRDAIDYQGESLEDAIEEVRQTIDGRYGPFLKECSFVIMEKGQAVAACFIAWTREKKMPLVAYSMTHPSFQNQGMGTFLLKKSINALLDRGHEKLYLVVTEGNLAAQHLYEKIGFRVSQ